MFEVEKTFTFEAGHVLKHHDGQCSRPHGHSYILVVKLRSDALIPSGPKTNMVIDFGDIAAAVKPMLDKYLDHYFINDTLSTDSSTVEFMAQWIYRYLKPLLPQLHMVTLFETACSKATYWEE